MRNEEYKKKLFELFGETEDMPEHAMGDVYKFIRDRFFEEFEGDNAEDWFYKNYETLSNEYDEKGTA